jgi:NAD(P)H-hydrate repair Nnr-like enzyme with NAD(P)H-hydrate epimerase domain
MMTIDVPPGLASVEGHVEGVVVTVTVATVTVTVLDEAACSWIPE